MSKIFVPLTTEPPNANPAPIAPAPATWTPVFIIPLFSWPEVYKLLNGIVAPTAVVPGGVFLMFRNGEVSKGLVDKLRGRKLTKIYAF